jgi:hypothetical protein
MPPSLLSNAFASGSAPLSSVWIRCYVVSQTVSRRSRVGARPRVQAAVGPELSSLAQPYSHDVPLDMPARSQQMLIALHRERLELALVHATIAHCPVQHPPPHGMPVDAPANSSLTKPSVFGQTMRRQWLDRTQ